MGFHHENLHSHSPTANLGLTGSAGYVDGFIVAKSVGGSGADAGGIQLHGDGFRGNISCLQAELSRWTSSMEIEDIPGKQSVEEAPDVKDALADDSGASPSSMDAVVGVAEGSTGGWTARVEGGVVVADKAGSKRASRHYPDWPHGQADDGWQPPLLDEWLQSSLQAYQAAAST